MDKELQFEYERQILSMIIGSDDNTEKQKHILSHLIDDMFTNKIYREIFRTLKDLEKSKKEINIANLIENSNKEHIKQYSIDLNKEYITNGNCDFYINKLVDNYVSNLVSESSDLEDYKKIQLIKDKYTVKKRTKPIADKTEYLFLEYINKWESAIKTYFPSIDKVIGSLQGGDIFIIGGSTGMGKTCFMLNLVMNMALRKKKILLFSLEMSMSQLQNRIISMQTGINSRKFRDFSLSDDEIRIYNNYINSDKFKKLNIDVVTDYDITIEKIREIVLSSESEIVFIDYLGLIKSSSKANSYERISAISRELKLLALEVDKPFVILHQLSRIKDDRKNKRPMISDLRDSGQIEQDADFIGFVFRPYYFDKTADPRTFEFLNAKSRHTAIKYQTYLLFDGEKQKITDPLGEAPLEEVKQCSLEF